MFLYKSSRLIIRDANVKNYYALAAVVVLLGFLNWATVKLMVAPSLQHMVFLKKEVRQLEVAWSEKMRDKKLRENSSKILQNLDLKKPYLKTAFVYLVKTHHLELQEIYQHATAGFYVVIIGDYLNFFKLFSQIYKQWPYGYWENFTIANANKNSDQQLKCAGVFHVAV